MPTEYCRHIHTNGRRCGSPALREQAFCYYHARSRRLHRPPRPASTDLVLHPLRADALGQAAPMVAASTQPFALEFPPLEDHESIQVAASMLGAALGRHQLDGKRAATMLYGLQVASAVTRVDTEPELSYFVQTEICNTPEGEDLSLDEDPDYDTDDE